MEREEVDEEVDEEERVDSVALVAQGVESVDWTKTDPILKEEWQQAH